MGNTDSEAGSSASQDAVDQNPPSARVSSCETEPLKSAHLDFPVNIGISERAEQLFEVDVSLGHQDVQALHELHPTMDAIYSRAISKDQSRRPTRPDLRALPSLQYAAPRWSLMSHRSATLPLFAKKPWLGSERQPSTPPIHPALSNFFLPSTDSPLSHSESLLQSDFPAEVSPTVHNGQSDQRPRSPPLRQATPTSALRPLMSRYDDGIHRTVPFKFPVESDLVGTSSAGTPTSHIQHLVSDNLVNATAQNPVPGKILAVATEMVASQSQSSPLQEVNSTNHRPLAKPELRQQHGDILATKSRPARVRPRLKEQVSGSAEPNAIRKKGQLSEEGSWSETVTTEENKHLTDGMEGNEVYGSLNITPEADGEWSGLIDSSSSSSSDSGATEVEVRDASEEGA